MSSSSEKNTFYRLVIKSQEKFYGVQAMNSDIPLGRSVL